MTEIYRRFDRCVNCGSFTTHVVIEGTSLNETYKIPSLFCSEKCRDEFYKLDRKEQLLKLRTDREKEEFNATKAKNNESKNTCAICDKDILGLPYKYVTPSKLYKFCSDKCLDKFIDKFVDKHNSKKKKDTTTKKDNAKWTARSNEQDIPLKCMTCGKNMFFNKHVTVIKTKNGKFIGMFCNDKCADNYYSKVQVKTHEVIRAERLKRDWHPDN